MKHLSVGVQVYSVRDDAAADFRGTMQKLKTMGYDFVELAGLYGMEPTTIKEILDEAGIPALSAHVPYQELLNELDTVLDAYRTIGCQYIVFPYLTADIRHDSPAFADTLVRMRQICEKACAKGFTVLYHNHDFEFVSMADGRFGLDFMYDTIGPDLLQTELDTCWIKVAGQDPAAYIRKYRNRCPIVHLKDFYKEGQTSDMYELIGIKNEKKEDTGNGSFEFRPLGQGLQDVPALLQAALESGAEYVVVEQDSSNGRPAMEAVSMSRAYLRSLGW